MLNLSTDDYRAVFFILAVVFVIASLYWYSLEGIQLITRDKIPWETRGMLLLMMLSAIACAIKALTL